MTISIIRAGILSLIFSMLTIINSTAQVVIGGLTPDTSAQLDIQSADKGVLLPRLSTAQRDSIVLPATSLLIYNLTTSCLEINLGLPSEPLWADLKCLGSISALQCADAVLSEALVVGDSSSESVLSIPYTDGNGGFYSSKNISSAGVSGIIATLPEGTFADGSGTLQLSLSGIPTQSGTAMFTLTIGGQSCVVEVSVSGLPTGYVHCDPTYSTVVQDVTNPVTGKTWMDRNLGAKRVATAYDDGEAFGDLFQWGRFADGHQCRNSPITSKKATTVVPNAGNSWDGKFIITETTPFDWLGPQNNNLWQGVNGVNNPCPAGYRLPTYPEFQDEIQSWSQNNRLGAFESPLKLTSASGRSHTSGEVGNNGSGGNYATSSISGTYVHILYFDCCSGAYIFSYSDRADGRSVRCLKD